MMSIRPNLGRWRAGAPIDWENPITRGLVAAYVFDDAFRLRLVDSTRIAGDCFQGGASANLVQFISDPQYGAVGRFGIIPIFNDCRFFQNTTYNLPAANTTMVQLVQPTTNLNAATFGNLDATTGGGPDAARYALSNPFAGVVYFDFGGVGGSNRCNYTPGGGYFNSWHVVAITAGSTGMEIWTDGLSKANNGGVSVTRTNAVTGFGVGGAFNNLASGGNNASIALHMIFTRILSAAEILLLTKDPYRIFVPQIPATNVRYFIPLEVTDIDLTPAAGSLVYTGGTPTLSFSGDITLSPGAGTITYTGGTPTVTLIDIGLTPGPGTITYTGGTPTLSLTIPVAPEAGQIVYAGGMPSISMVRTVGSGNQLYIGDVDFACFYRDSTARITKQLSGDWSMEFELNYYGGARPARGAEVAFFWSSTKRFGGFIQSVSERGEQGAAGRFSVLSIKCGGFQLVTDRVIIAKLFTLFLGGLPGIIIYEIWYEKLRQFGITAPSGGFGSAIVIGEQLFHYITVTEAFNRVKMQDPGKDWWIDDNKLLHYESTVPAVANAPFTLRDGDGNHDFMSVKNSDVRFRNKQWVLPSADLEALRTDTDIGDGVTTSFPTVYVQSAQPIVKVNGVEQIVTELGDWISGWQFYYIPGGIGVFAATAPGSGDVVEISYANQFPIAYSAQDDVSIAAVGLYEAIWQAKNVFDQETAENEAQGLLDLYSADGIPVEIVFDYNSSRQPLWLTPGMILDSITTFPLSSGNYTIEQVVSQEVRRVWKHTVTMRAGLGEVTDAQAKEQFRISARVPLSSPPYRMTSELYTDLPGITNPGALVGPISNRFVVRSKGIIDSWDFLMDEDPPIGADLIIDVSLNGVSLFTPTFSDLVIDAIDDTKATSVEHPFNASDVGKVLEITAGGSFFVGTWATVLSVAAGVATFDTALGVTGSANGSGTFAPTLIDLEIDGGDATKATSALHPFVAGDVGTTLNVLSGTGFTVQRVTILSEASGVATFDAPLGTAGSMGGVAQYSYDDMKPRIPDGVTTLQKGIRFWVYNQPVAEGDVMTVYTLQIGSSNPGTNATFHLNMKVTPNAGNGL